VVVKGGRCVRLTSPPSVSRFSKQCGILDISQPYRLPLPVSGKTLFVFVHAVRNSCYGDSFTLLYVDDVRTSQEACITTVCYGDSFTLLYVYGVRTSQEAWTTTVRYGDSFTLLYVYDVRTSQEAWTTTVRYGELYFIICR
jgi:hypothetical protein